MTWNSGTMQDFGCERVSIDREGWQAVIDALDGDESRLDEALDAMNKAPPSRWLEEQS